MKQIIFTLLIRLFFAQQIAYGQCKGNLIFQDEFNGNTLDQSKWNYDLGNGCPSLCGWGNNEKEYYTNSTSNVNVSGGFLNLTAIHNPNYLGSGADFTSGKINTKGKFDRLYGRFEARIKMPSGTGLWPAFWLLPTDNEYGNWPTSGEIDIMEFRGDQQSTSFSTLHYGNAWPGNLYDGTTYNLPSGNFTNAYHEFAVEWQPGVLKFYVDNILIKTETQNPNTLSPASNNAVVWPWDKKYYIILNLALGGWFSGNPSTQDILNSTTFPQSLQVDYVRVYDMAPNSSQAPYAGTVITIPGKVEAENYNIGCEGDAYHDTDAGNNGGTFRTESVDIEACADAGGGYNVGWTEPGEWLNYSVNINTTGNYNITARIASLDGNKKFHLELDGANISGPMTAPATGAWNTFQTISVNNVPLTSGNKNLKIVFDDGGVNFNWVQFDQVNTNSAPLVSITSLVNGATFNAPALVKIEANATDNGSISKVEFFQGNVKLGEDLSSPYSFDWSNVGAGTYKITAKATDNTGLTTTSSEVSITVNTGQLTGLPLDFLNSSTYKDDQIYAAVVGIDMNGAHVWVDMKTGTQMPMSPSYNTVGAPVYNGNKGPGNNGMYANCFTKLSEIPNKRVDFQKIQGCRIFVSFGQQLYLYFFGSTGAVVGYTSPNHTDPTDPNTGIKYEIIELTYNQYGFWGNTTRVDGYSYPMGLELTGGNGFQKTGELKLSQDIAALYLASVPTEFKNCYNSATGNITFPTKTIEFADGSVGTMPIPGPYVDYMKPYIDAIWAKYVNEDLIFDAGDAGIWKGRVINERLEMTAQTGGFTGRKGIVVRRPTTQEAFEGKGVLNNVVQDGTTDLIIQAQLCAAISRHVINTTTPNVGQQNWSNPATFYQASPCNYYAKFWHEQGVSYNQKSYAFAYDDVFDQSSTLHSPTPSNVKVVIGGYGVSALDGNGDGLTGSYYNGMNFDTPVSSKKDPILNTDWGTGSPMSGVNDDHFTVRWTGKIEPRYTDEYTFYITSDNGRKVWVNNQLILDKWVNDWDVEYSGKISLVAGQKYDIKIEMFEDFGGSNVKLEWSSAKQSRQVVPTSQLYSNSVPTVSIVSPIFNSVQSVNSNISITANANDLDGINKVEFFEGSNKIGEVVNGPYIITWSSSIAGTKNIRAVATDNKGAIAEGQITFLVDSPTVISNFQSNELSYYPNPTKDVLYFGTEIDQISIYSVNGVLIKSVSLDGKNHLNTSDLITGMYVFEVKTKQGTSFIKISKE